MLLVPRNVSGVRKILIEPLLHLKLWPAHNASWFATTSEAQLLCDIAPPRTASANNHVLAVGVCPAYLAPASPTTEFANMNGAKTQPSVGDARCNATSIGARNTPPPTPVSPNTKPTAAPMLIRPKMASADLVLQCALVVRQGSSTPPDSSTSLPLCTSTGSVVLLVTASRGPSGSERPDADQPSRSRAESGHRRWRAPAAPDREATDRGWWSSAPPVVGATVVVVVGAAVVVVAGTVVVEAAVVVAVARVVVVDGSEVVVEAAGDVVLVATEVMLGSSTNGSLGSGRPAIATPASPPTTITTIANGHEIRVGRPSYRRTRQRRSAPRDGHLDVGVDGACARPTRRDR